MTASDLLAQIRQAERNAGFHFLMRDQNLWNARDSKTPQWLQPNLVRWARGHNRKGVRFKARATQATQELLRRVGDG